ncbi:MAG: choice-of-anchor D domain-containing protein [Gammaproteobacteria bacterium]
MTGFVRARLAAFVILLSAAMWPAPQSHADVFLFEGEIFFCLGTCDSFAALGGSTGGAANTTNSIVTGEIDVPVQPDGSFSFSTTDGVPFLFSIENASAPPEDPVFAPDPVCTGQADGELCNPNTTNPLPLDSRVATVSGSGIVGADGNFESGTVQFVFTAAPFSNNQGEVTFDLSDSSAEGTILGVITFTRISGAFVPAPPDLAVSVGTFPDTQINTSSTADVTVSNNGDGAGRPTVDTTALAEPFSIEAGDDACTGNVLDPGATCIVTVTYSPTTDDMVTGEFAITDPNNDPMSVPVALTANGIAPEIELDTLLVEFEDVPVGDSADLPVTVTNDGPVSLNISNVTAPAAPFSVDDAACTTAAVASGGTCVITVTFTPTDVADAMGSFAVESDDLDEPSVTVELTGTVALPEISIDPVIVEFDQLLTDQTDVLSATVSNVGGADLVIDSVTPPPATSRFSLANEVCSGVTLAPMETCDLMFEFAPDVEGVFEATYSVASNDLDDPNFTGMLTGSASQAPEPSILVSLRDVDLGEVVVSEVGASTLTISSNGSAPLEVSELSISGSNAGDFSRTEECLATIMDGDACEFTVMFAPADVGAREATLTVTSNATVEPTVDIDLSGTGVSGPQLTLAETTLSIGSAEAPIELDQSATASFMVISSGSSDVTVASIALSGDGAAQFAITDEDCTANALASMDVCNVEVTFAPATAGDKSAIVTVTSNDVDEPEQTVMLTGFVFAGSRPDFSVPELEVGSSTAPVTVGNSGTTELSITNTGTDPLMVVSVMLGGPDAAEFSLDEDCSATPVDRNDDCTINVIFTPTSPGTKTAEVQITTDSVVTRQFSRGATQMVTIVPIMATAAEPPPPPPPPAGSQTNIPPAFATSDQGSNGACFIATAAFGSYLDPNVKVLRDFRDNVLMRNNAGRSLVKFYYANSPMIADYIARHEGARTATRFALTPLIYAMAYPVPALLVLMAAWGLLRRRRVVRLAA